MKTISNYLSLVRFSHTIFAMPFALIGFALGVNAYLGGIGSWSFTGDNAWQIFVSVWQEYNWSLKLLLVILCMVFARSAAMAFNRYLDRSFDAKNPRTAIREIPAGIISKESALRFALLNAALFVACTYFINKHCFILSPVALIVVLGYSYTKRFTPLCHLILGVGLSLAPIGAFLAVTGKFAILPILFSLAVIFWVSGFDIIYALQDEEFDRANRLYSIPAWLGKPRALRVAAILHFLSAVCVFAAGLYGRFGWFYAIGLAVFMGMLVYQHSLVKPADLSKVNIAFMKANGIASVIFAVFVIADLVARY